MKQPVLCHAVEQVLAAPLLMHPHASLRYHSILCCCREHQQKATTERNTQHTRTSWLRLRACARARCPASRRPRTLPSRMRNTATSCQRRTPSVPILIEIRTDRQTDDRHTDTVQPHLSDELRVGKSLHQRTVGLFSRCRICCHIRLLTRERERASKRERESARARVESERERERERARERARESERESGSGLRVQGSGLTVEGLG